MPPVPPRRLFIGLLPDREFQQRIARHAAEWHWPPEARRTRFGRYHLTLHFLGDLHAGPENRIRAALRTVEMQPLEIMLDTPLLWKQGIAVLRPAPHAGLQALRERIVQCLPPAGPRPLLAFTPHVTLARDAFDATPPRAAACIRCSVREFVLVWSRLDTRPAEYVVLERFRAGESVPAAPGGFRGEQVELFGRAAESSHPPLPSPGA